MWFDFFLGLYCMVKQISEVDQQRYFDQLWNKHHVQFRKRNDENILEFENFIMIIQKFFEQLEFNF